MTKLEIIDKLPDEGVLVENSQSLENIDDDILKSRVIILEFPSFMDGRAFSQARQLRRIGFKGKIVASGDLRADQGRQYALVGITALYFQGKYDKITLESNLKRYPGSYQSSSLNKDVIYNKRIQDNKPHFSGGGSF